MRKKTLLLTALMAMTLFTISSCTADMDNLRRDPETVPTAVQLPDLPTATQDLLPLPSPVLTEAPPPESLEYSTETQAPVPTATIDIKDIQIDVAPRPGALAAPVYIVQAGTPAKLENFIQPNLGCNWTGIAGQV